MLGLLALAVIAGTNLEDIPVNRAYASAVDGWARCTLQVARSWWKLTQPAETIADGALGKCHPEQELMEDRTAAMFLQTMDPSEARRQAHMLTTEAAGAQRQRLVAVILDLIANPKNMTH